jgi:PTH1 family peptidyl-tRNA hydrolase
VASHLNVQLSHNAKFNGMVGSATFGEDKLWLLFPTQFMNLSGQSVRALAHFYKIVPDEILVAHDDIDLATGVIRIKMGGGEGGHNGLRDITEKLGTQKYGRIRIGVGHPGHSSAVTNYVLNKPSIHDRKLIDEGIANFMVHLDDVLAGKFEQAMNSLHRTK